MKIMHFVLAAIWIWLAGNIGGDDFSVVVANMMMLAIGIWAGYHDGKKAGKRELLTGRTK